MASRYVSAHSPEVKVIFPTGGGILRDKFTVRWQASDLDGDRLTYSLLYIPITDLLGRLSLRTSMNQR